MEKIYENPLKLLGNKKSSTKRVKSYLKAYSSSSLLSTRSDFKPAKVVKEEFTLRSYQTRNQLSIKEEKRKQAEESKQKADLIYDISVAKSDKLEI